MSQTRNVAGELQTDKQSSVVEVDHQSAMCYFQPETEELIFISETESAKLENHSNEMILMVDRMHSANSVYLKMMDLYAKASEKPGTSKNEKEDLATQVSAAEAELEEERKKVLEALGDFSQKGKGYADVVELVPVGAPGRGRRPYAYVSRQYFDPARDQGRLRNVGIRASDRQSNAQSIYRVDRNGTRRIDTNLLKKQMTNLELSTLKLELKDVMAWAGAEKVLDDLKKDYAIFAWAESWNESLAAHKTINDELDVSGGAQFMRFISNVGASAEYKPDTGQVVLKGEATASLTLASGKAGFTYFVPDRVGWSWIYKRANGESFDIGRLRVALAGELQGFIGGSVVLGGQLQIVTKDDQQLLAGQTSGRLPRFSERQTRNAVFYRQMKAEDEGLDISVQGFAGAQVEGSLKGTVQWLKPAGPPDVKSGVKTTATNGEYVDLCSISPSIGGLLGVGAGMSFHCTFINGKFCFRIAASLCFGVGAKGGLACEVNTKDIIGFGCWLAYQLYKLDYAFFDLISEDGYEAYTKFSVLQMLNVDSDLYADYSRMRVGVEGVSDEFARIIKSIVGVPGRVLADSKERNALARNTVEFKERLLSYTPESKAILIYLLTRHGKLDDLDHESYGAYMDRHHDRKEAVVCVLWSIQTRTEWNRVMSRVSENGKRKNKSAPLEAVVKSQENSLIEFLQIGFNRDDEIQKRKSEFEGIHESLKDKPVAGYSLAMNNTAYYQLNSCDNPGFPSDCMFGPYQEV